MPFWPGGGWYTEILGPLMKGEGKAVAAKRVAWTDPIALDEVKAAGKVLDCSVNDVLLATVAGALRRYLAMKGDRVDGLELRAMVPVNLRASAMALSIFLIHLFGDMWSPEIVGRLSDRTGSLRQAVLVLPGALLVCATLWFSLAIKTSRANRGKVQDFRRAMQSPERAAGQAAPNSLQKLCGDTGIPPGKG